MGVTRASFFRRLVCEQQGQAMVWLTLALGMVMMGVGGITIDIARLYGIRTQLQNSTNAAGLAAAGYAHGFSQTTALTPIAQTYVSDNPVGTMTEVTGYPQVVAVCLNALESAGFTCANTNNAPNAVKVVEQIRMPTTFMRLFGVSSLIVQSTATAAMAGVGTPLNIAVIMDSTGSMNVPDSNCGTNTEFQCAFGLVRSMLAQLPNTCSISSACSDGYDIRVALFTFPNVSTPTAHYDIDCLGKPTALPYTFPAPTNNYYKPMVYQQNIAPKTKWTATYEVTYNLANDPTVTVNAASDADANGFVTNYYDPSTPDNLNYGSSLVKAVGNYANPGGCLTYTQGIVNSGIGNTNFAGAIYAAQSALLAEQAAHPGSANVIVYVSDGQANLFKNQFPDNTSANSSVGCNSGTYSGGNYSLTNCGTSTAAQTGAVYLTPATFVPNTVVSPQVAMAGYSTQTGTGHYPDWNDQCQQAIVAANYASTYPNNPTRVIGVAYGAESSGCGSGWNYTDNTYVATGAYNVGITPISTNLIPCTTVADIASIPAYAGELNFYSDYKQTGSGVDQNCIGTSTDLALTNMQNIGQNIGEGFSQPKLVSNGLN